MFQIATREPIAQTVAFMAPAPSAEETQRCSNHACGAGPWHVEQLSAQNSLWRVSSASDGSYLVAGVTPACPFCGRELATPGV